MSITLVDRIDEDGHHITVKVSPEVERRLSGKLKSAFGAPAETAQVEAFTPDETGEAARGNELRSIVQRIERMEEEKKTIADDIKEVYAEAKANGYDAKVLRKVVAIRKRDLRERREEEAIFDLYLQAVGESQ
jgi:uncharacterized protein (UPF0335 family)